MTLIGAREDEQRRRALRRWIAASALAHAALAAGLAWAPSLGGRPDLPPVVQVQLMASAPAPGPPGEAAPAPPPEAEAEPEPEPAPAPAPEPEPEPPEPAKTVLPEEPRQAPEPEPEPESPPEPETEPEPAEEPEPETTPARDAPEPARKRAVAEDRRRREEEYSDVLARLRSEQGEAGGSEGTPAPAERAGPPGGPGIPVSAEVRAWMRRAKVHVTRAWVLSPGFRREPLETEVRVQLGPTGEVLSVEIVEGSGNPWYDESVERAVRKASPLPEPPRAEEWRFVFRPEDLRR